MNRNMWRPWRWLPHMPSTTENSHERSMSRQCITDTKGDSKPSLVLMEKISSNKNKEFRSRSASNGHEWTHCHVFFIKYVTLVNDTMRHNLAEALYFSDFKIITISYIKSSDKGVSRPLFQHIGSVGWWAPRGMTSSIYFGVYKYSETSHSWYYGFAYWLCYVQGCTAKHLCQVGLLNRMYFDIYDWTAYASDYGIPFSSNSCYLVDILPTELLDEILAYAVDKFEDALSLNLTHSKFHHQARRWLWHLLLIEVSPHLGLDCHIWYRRCWNNVFTFFSEYEILRQYVRALIVVDPRGGGPMASSNDIGRCLRLFGRLECLELAHVPVQLIISALQHCPRIRQM